jgi:hypothetical protein
MTIGTTVAATAARDRLQTAVSDAARRLYDAEAALRIARQTGVGAWIGAAYDRLHEAVVDHSAAMDALEGITQALPPAHGASGQSAAA